MDKSTLKAKFVHALKWAGLVAILCAMGAVMTTACWCAENLQSANDPTQEGRDNFMNRVGEAEWRARGLYVQVSYAVRTRHWTAYYTTFSYPLETNVPPVTKWVVLDNSNRRYYVPIDKL